LKIRERAAQHARKAGDAAPEVQHKFLPIPRQAGLNARTTAGEGTRWLFSSIAGDLVPGMAIRKLQHCRKPSQITSPRGATWWRSSPQTRDRRKSQRDNKLGFPDPELHHTKWLEQRFGNPLCAAGLAVFELYKELQ